MSSPAGLNRVPFRDPELVVRPLDGKVLVLDPKRPVWLLTNRTGGQIARACDGKRTVREIAATIGARYRLPAAALYSDVLRFTREAADIGLIRIGAPPVDTEAKFAETVPLKSALLCLTEECNLRCLHCYNRSGVPHPAVLTRQQVASIFAQLRESGVERVGLSGGEPILHPEFWDVLDDAWRAGLTATINTNGTLIDDEAARRFAAAGAHVKISMDGPRSAVHDRLRGKGAFDRSLRGIEALRGRLPSSRIVISFSPVQFNFRRLPEMVAWVRSLGLHRLHISALMHNGRARDNWSELGMSKEDWAWLYRTMVDLGRDLESEPVQWQLSGGCIDLLDNRRPLKGCGFGAAPCIDAHGDVSGCEALTDSRFVLGNVRTSSLRDVLNGARLRHWRRRFAERINSPRCQKCEFRNYCGGGCAAEALAATGDPMAETHYCGAIFAALETFFLNRAEACERTSAAQVACASGGDRCH